MKVTLYAISAAAVLAATAVQAAESVPGGVGTPPAAPIQCVPAGLWSTARRSGLAELRTECGVAFAWQPRLGRCARAGDVGLRNHHAELEQWTGHQ